MDHNNRPPQLRDVDAAVAARIANYTPRKVSEHWWLEVGDEVRAAVTAARPSSPQIATGHLNALVRFLASPVGWKVGTRLDIAALLSLQSVEVYTNFVVGIGSKSRQRHALRAVGRAIGVVPLLNPSPPAALTRVNPLVQAAGHRPIGAALLAAVISADRGTVPKALFDSFARANPQVSATAAAANPSTVWAPATLQSLAEVTHRREKATVTSDSRKKTDPSSTVKPLSRTAALAQARKAMAAQQRAEAAEADPVAPDAVILAAIEGFLPRLPNRPVWEQNEQLATDLVLAYEPGSARNAKKVCSFVAVFLTWFASWPGRATNSPSIRRDELFAQGVLEAFVASHSSTERSMSTARSALRRCIDSLHPDGRPARISRPPVVGPYDDQTCRTFILLAKNQPTDAATKRICLLVGLPLGAGLDAGDMRALTATSFSDVDVDGVPVLTVTVINGRRSRTVPVRHDIADLIRTALRIHAAAGQGPSARLLGRVEDRTNIVPTDDRVPVTAGDPAPSISIMRLRNTWLVAAMCSNISLADLLKAAGFSTPRTITDLLPHCPPQDPTVVARTLTELKNPSGGNR